MTIPRSDEMGNTPFDDDNNDDNDDNDNNDNDNKNDSDDDIRPRADEMGNSLS
eukprot:CAMPEP_0170172670 /NCGR_PEP_ID=MMETSP0040_2-20121228/5905_1 /TAXON_ID=641309 /ORGANISM="Lotharella oceanica, Strain CCMP622" /LENGTH=52 /DNA_ID=CAMNT_0010413457 /DNA_START=113 /DNA_END=268 /DNA_ORIENTATION=-